MIKKLPWPEIVVTATAIGLGVGVYAYAHRDQGDLEESKRRGEFVVQALREYHDAHGTYPERLEDLTPQHVAEVPQPTWGTRRWSYRRYTADDSVTVHFQLSVAADGTGYPLLYYDPAVRDWVLNN